MDVISADAAPTPAQGHLSVARLERQWFIGCRSSELKQRPLARRIQRTPVVLYRTDRGEPVALLDRCPHRNVPLSIGRVQGKEIECRYHGWRFDPSGECTAIPGLCSEVTPIKSRRAPTFATRE